MRPTTIVLVFNSLRARRAARSLPPVLPVPVCNVVRSCNAWFHSSAGSRSIFPVKERRDAYHDTDIPNIGQAMEAWFYDVNKDGWLKVRSAMDVHVQPLDPQKHPKMDKLFINMMFLGKEKLTGSELLELTKNYVVNVNMDEGNSELEISIRQKSDSVWPALCHLQVPIKYEVDVTCSHSGAATLANLEGDNIQVKTLDGHCTLKSIKSGTVNVQTRDGNVVSPNLIQGNVSIKCGGTGEINATRLQGQKVECRTRLGDIKVKAIYADEASFSSSCGNIRLGSCHGNSEVHIKDGNLTVDTLDGNLDGNVTSGNAEVSMARGGNVNLNTECGDILLKVPEAINCNVDLTGTEINSGEVSINNTQIDEDKNLKKLTGKLGANSDHCMITAKTKKGKIQLSYYSWLASLNLGNNPCS